MKRTNQFSRTTGDTKPIERANKINTRLIREYENWLKNINVDATPEEKLEYLTSHIQHHIKILNLLEVNNIQLSEIDYIELIANYTITDMESIYKKDVPLISQDYFKVFNEELRIFNVYIKQKKVRDSFDPRLVALLKTVEKGNNHIKWMWNKTNVTELKLIQETLFPHLGSNAALLKIYKNHLPEPSADENIKSPNSNSEK